jgi:hypothetical protein
LRYWWIFIVFFVESLLKKPLLFSKIQHSKSSGNDKVKWSDWIHIWIGKDNNPIFFFLESKIIWKFSKSLKEAIESQSKFLTDKNFGIENEINILFSNMHTINALGWKFLFWEFEDYINPYRRSEKNLNFELVSLISYELWNYYNDSKNKKYIENKTIKKRIIKVLEEYKNVSDILDNRKVYIFLLPLVSVFELIKQYLNKLNEYNE